MQKVVLRQDVFSKQPGEGDGLQSKKKLDAGLWQYHANRMDARRSQFDLGRVVAYI